jgi:hypothetical protein
MEKKKGLATFSAKTHEYCGTFAGKHVFKNIVYTPSELIMVEEARYNELDNTAKYFRLLKYAESTLSIEDLKRL